MASQRQISKTEREEIRVLRQQLQHATALIEKLTKDLTSAQQTIEDLVQHRFGRKSEKRGCEGQGHLFEMGEPPPEEEPLEDVPSAPKRRRRRKANPEESGFAKGLPRNVIHQDPPELERSCSCCQKEMVRIGEDVTERLTCIPRRFTVNRYVRGRWACSCKEGGVVQTPAQPGLIDRSKYEASIHSLIVSSKYLLHLPLYRLEAEFRSQGICLSRSTMWDLCERTAELMKPVVLQMEREILASRHVQLDDSFLTVVTPGEKGSKKAHLWVVRSGRGAFYRITRSRNREVPKELLAGWGGDLFQGDGHDCYGALAAPESMIRVGCWAHARRSFVSAEKEDPKIAGWFLRQMRRMFLIERRLKQARDDLGLTVESFERLRFEVRRRLTRRIIDRIERKRCELVHADLPPLPKSRIGKALSYLKSQHDSLKAVLVAGCLEIDNNASERDLRHGVIGRKNWQMTSAENGAEVMELIFTLAINCKALGVHFESYLNDVLPRLSTVAARDVASLTPWAWADARAEAVEAP